MVKYVRYDMRAILSRIAVVAAFCTVCFTIAYALVMLINTARVLRLTAEAQRTSVDHPTALAAMPTLVRGSRFEGRWQLNGSYQWDRLNLYIVRSNAMVTNRLAPFRDNCSAAAQWSVIICDAAFLDTYLDRRGVFVDLAPDRVTAARDAFVAWTIGHEIAHVLGGDQPAHFKPSALDEQVTRASVSHRQELAADAFLVQQFANDSARRLAVENLALDLLNSELRRKVGGEALPSAAGIVFDYTNQQVVRYVAGGTHPEHFVRAARILTAAGELPGNESLRAMVKPLIAQLGGER